MDRGIADALASLQASVCTRQEWLEIGMALNEEGYDVSAWDEWSKNDSRYHAGECEKLWRGFGGKERLVKGGTIVEIAKSHGYSPKKRPVRVFDWDDEIEYDGELVTVQYHDRKPLNAAAEMAEYLQALFKPQEYVNYVTSVGEDLKPNGKGVYARTCGEIVEALKEGDIERAIGTYNASAGVWVRLNPLDGKGIKDSNVTAFRHLLIESDTASIEEQLDSIRRLGLPVVMQVYSGKKSVHTIVRVDAKDKDEYRERAAEIYKACRDIGFDVDEANKNPGRLSRLPGVQRGGQWQYLMARKSGAASYEEWHAHYQLGGLPPVSKGIDITVRPKKAEELIEGILRRGDKLMIQGPSKAGKTYFMLELAICLAEGAKWLGKFRCRKSRVLFVNFELRSENIANRMLDIYAELKLNRTSGNLDFWNLRGHARPLADLSESLIEVAKDYDVVVLDPIYKIQAGEENNAKDISNFCNEIDIISRKAKASVLYSHHHSKGYKGGIAAADRSSGSGVFARDADALIDLSEIDQTGSAKQARKNELQEHLNAKYGLRDGHTPTDEQLDEYTCELEQNTEKIDALTAFKVSFVLREFRSPKPFAVWFEHPIHTLVPELDNAALKGDLSQAAMDKRREEGKKEQLERDSDEKKARLAEKYKELSAKAGREPTKTELAKALGIHPNTLSDWLKKYGYTKHSTKKGRGGEVYVSAPLENVF